MIDLLRVTREDYFCIFSHSGNERLYHMGGQILGFIANYELPRGATAPDIGERLQIEHSFPDEVLKHIERLRAVSEKEFEIVIDRLHPRPEFLFLCSRQKPYVISHRDDRSCYQKPAVCVLLEHFFKPHRQGQQGFPGSRPPNQSNNFYLIIKEKFERKFLFLVQRPYPPATRLTIAQMK